MKDEIIELLNKTYDLEDANKEENLILFEDSRAHRKNHIEEELRTNGKLYYHTA